MFFGYLFLVFGSVVCGVVVLVVVVVVVVVDVVAVLGSVSDCEIYS